MRGRQMDKDRRDKARDEEHGRTQRDGMVALDGHAQRVAERLHFARAGQPHDLELDLRRG